ncbi:hypothetical protein EU538_05405 [Candidatus Thorarchaeota archaeon]|nr:MAG: hypothetical protein EU538_05405 [Candidatus Thorarchaeota archaeon]
MVLRRIFGRKKDDEDEEAEEAVEKETEAEEAVEGPEAASEVEEETEEATEETAQEEAIVKVGGTIPYHSAFLERLEYMFNDDEIAADMENTDSFALEFMVLGERIWVRKPEMGDVEVGTGAVSDEDAHIRISNETAQELLGAANFEEFSDIYLEHYKNPQPGKFVKITLRKDISNLNRRGYARVPLLKLLIGAVR